MRISEPARRHGVTDLDIEHAVRMAWSQIDMGEGLTMVFGPSANGAPLEVGVLDIDGDDPAVIHAMPARAKFARFHP